jgi:anti-anti-sigma regulatory factor
MEQQATELRAYTAEQQRLIDLVAVLETPAIVLAEGVLLAPVVGALDQQRAQALTRRLLEMVSVQRTQLVILDLAGVPAVDAAVAHAVLQAAEALRLLGCKVVLTGISSAVAMTLTELDIDLNTLTTARSPQEVLAVTQQAPVMSAALVH